MQKTNIPRKHLFCNLSTKWPTVLSWRVTCHSSHARRCALGSLAVLCCCHSRRAWRAAWRPGVWGPWSWQPAGLHLAAHTSSPGCPFVGLPAATPGFPWSRLSRKSLNLSAVDSPARCASRILPARNQCKLWDVACEQVSTDVVPVW